jgi:hypothetical protein
MATANIYQFNPPVTRKRAPRLPGKWAITHPAPKQGWTCAGIDVGQDETCEMCEWKDIHNVYIMDHPGYSTLRCGSECAGSMQANAAATKAMRGAMRQKLDAQKTCQKLFDSCVEDGNKLPQGMAKDVVVDRLALAYTALRNGTADKPLAAALRTLLVTIQAALAPVAAAVHWAHQRVASNLLPGWIINHNGNLTRRWDSGATATIFRTTKAAKYRLVVNPVNRPAIFVKQSETDPAVLASKAEALT